jgi:hypothetical protein
MAETLFITPAEITGTTIMGGNVDPDRYITNIAFVQISVIEPLLGTELYDKIIADFEAETLVDLYLTLFDDFVKPITKHTAIAEYIEISPFLVENGGAFKHTADGREALTRQEIEILSGKYRAMAQMYVQRFNKWICHNTIPEYKRWQDAVNAQKIDVNSGLFFTDRTAGYNWEIDKPNG